MNGEQLGKFSSAEDDHKLIYAKVLGDGVLFDSPCIEGFKSTAPHETQYTLYRGFVVTR